MPETVAEMCSPSSTAVLVYNVQVGILSHVQNRDGLIGRMRAVITAARAADVPVVAPTRTPAP